MRTSRFLVLLLALLSGHSGSVWAQGAMVLTGHDPDFHHIYEPPPDNPRTEGFITACLDFLVFGKKASPEQVGKRPATKIAYLDGWIHRDGSIRRDGSRGGFKLVSGYTNPIVLDLMADDWHSALVPGAFDVVMIGSYNSLRPENMDALLGGKERFQTFLNRGGKLFVMVQQKQEDYGFLPRFGAAAQALDNEIGNFYTTRAGDSIGITDNMINTDITHQQFKNVDTSIFKVFERTRETTPDGQHDLPVTIGFNGLLMDTIFVPVDPVSRVQQPHSSIASGSFLDSLCVEFFSLTEGATLAYSLDGTSPALSSLRLPNHGRLCFHETTNFRVLGQKTGWLNSRDTTFTYTYKPPQVVPQVAKPEAGQPSGTSFLDSLCVTFSTATPGAILNHVPGGGIPDSTSAVLASPGTLCFHQTTTISLIGRKAAWKTSDSALFTYTLKPHPLPSSLSLFHEGKLIEVVNADFSELEVRLKRAPGDPCANCTAQVSVSGSADRESVPLTAKGASFNGTFIRLESTLPFPGDGRLQHLETDSIIVVWTNPENPKDVVRRSYPFIDFVNIIGIIPQNSVAKTTSSQLNPDGNHWIISDAPNLEIQKSPKEGWCCSIVAMPVNAQNPDSLRMVGILVEASRGFSLDLKVFSHLGESVNQVGFTVSDSEFPKLGKVPGKETRFMRLLWNGRTGDGSRAGNGVYIFKTAITLLPVPGIAKAPVTATSSCRVGILRSQE